MFRYNYCTVIVKIKENNVCNIVVDLRATAARRFPRVVDVNRLEQSNVHNIFRVVTTACTYIIYCNTCYIRYDSRDFYIIVYRVRRNGKTTLQACLNAEVLIACRLGWCIWRSAAVTLDLVIPLTDDKRLIRSVLSNELFLLAVHGIVGGLRRK